MKKQDWNGWRIAAVVVAVFAVAGTVAMFLADCRVAGSVVARPLSWLTPLVVASVVLGVSGVLLAQRRSRDEGNTSFDRTECPACRREVMGQWRMCPYCGAMLEGSTA
ncbi:hypothetical protein EG835_09750 [bacterium]|nr:hypothetical protein [bacterium]